jgi:hypothetical protein
MGDTEFLLQLGPERDEALWLVLPERGSEGISSPAEVERLVLYNQEKARLAGALTLRNRAVRSMIESSEIASEARHLNGRRYWRNEDGWCGLLLLDRHSVLFGAPDWLEVHAAQRGAPQEGQLAEAFEAAAGHDFVFAARFNKPSVLTDRVLRWLRDQDATRPLQSACGVLLVVDMQKELIVDCRFDFADAEAAEKALPALRALQKRALKQLTLLAIRGTIASLAEEAREEAARLAAVGGFCASTAGALNAPCVRRNGFVARLSWRCNCDTTATGALGLLVNPICAAATRLCWPQEQGDESVRDHLEKLAMALRAYHEANGRLPPAALCDTDGKALLSWRVQLLPYLGEEKLYKQFHLDEPWDSRHNIQLVPKMPAVFGTSNNPNQRPGAYFRVITGKGTLFEGPQGVSMKEVRQPAQRLLVVKAVLPVAWTKAEELTLPEKGHFLEEEVVGQNNELQAAFADGTVELLYTDRGTQDRKRQEKYNTTVHYRVDGPEAVERGELLRQAALRAGVMADRHKLTAKPR